MVTDSLAAVLSACTGPLSDNIVAGLPQTRVGGELAQLLEQTNGFIGFMSALLVRGTGEEPGMLGNWNDPTGWRASYGHLAEGLFFFGEDIFGTQFALRGEHVVLFDPETGDCDVLGTSMQDWAGYIMADWQANTGYHIAKQWQEVHGPLAIGQRLVPHKLFVLGGEFDISNLKVVDDVPGMLARGPIAQQLHEIPDGEHVTLSPGE